MEHGSVWGCPTVQFLLFFAPFFLHLFISSNVSTSILGTYSSKKNDVIIINPCMKPASLFSACSTWNEIWLLSKLLFFWMYCSSSTFGILFHFLISTGKIGETISPCGLASSVLLAEWVKIDLQHSRFGGPPRDRTLLRRALVPAWWRTPCAGLRGICNWHGHCFVSLYKLGPTFTMITVILYKEQIRKNE